MTPLTDERRRAKLRRVAEQHGLELAGISVVWWPRTPARLALLREAWAVVEPDARAGRLSGELAFANFGKYRPGWRPRAWWVFSAPEGIERPDTEEAETALLHAIGELSPAEIASLGVTR